MGLDLKNIRSKISSPWLVALIPFIITVVFTSGYFNRYKLKLISRDTVGKNLSVYSDLDCNGNSEYIYFYTYQNAQVLIHDFNQKMEEIYDLPGKWFDGHAQIPAYFIGDSDNDSIKEIFAFSITDNDSLFVTGIQHYPEKKIMKNKFITRLEKSGNEYDYILTPLGLEDNNGDGNPELLFVINAGFPLQPRAIYAWDIKNDTIYRSPQMGCAIKTIAETSYFQDVNGDSVKEIFLRTLSPNNYDDSISVPYTDQKSWFMVFTKGLKFLFEPINIGTTQLVLSPFPVVAGDSVSIGVGIYNDRTGDDIPFFQSYNAKGIKLDESDIVDFNSSKWNQLIKKNNRYYLMSVLDGNLRIYLLKNNLKKIEKSVSISGMDYYYFFYDIDSDGEEEIIVDEFLYEKLHVFRSNLENETVTDLTYKPSSAVQGISVALKNHRPDHFHLIIDGVANNLGYTKNKWYYLNFVIALLYYLALGFSFTLLKKSWLYNLEKKQLAEKEMHNLQMQTVMNQLNPHFTYNAINTVGSAILNSEPQKAYDSLTRLSRLFRRVVDQAFLPYKTLGEEIDFVRDYLDVEKSRFGDKLNYEINAEKGIDRNLKIPKMLIQLFVENSIKHGIFHKKEEGKVTINVSQSGSVIKITVEDNGVGRKIAALQNKGRQGKGMVILRNYLNLFKEQFNRDITFEHSDILKNGEVYGTKVEILVYL